MCYFHTNGEEIIHWGVEINTTLLFFSGLNFNVFVKSFVAELVSSVP